MTGYTTREVAEVVGIPPASVRRWARSGVLAPTRGSRREYRFSFRDIVLLRVVRDLVEADVAPRKVRRSLERLRERLPAGRPLSSVRISTDGGRVLVAEGGSLWDADSGQLQIGFAVADLAARAAPFARRAAAVDPDGLEDRSADDWYDLAHDLEAVAPGEARKAYRRALALQPDHPEAHLNLGRLLHEAGRLEEAGAHYRKALEADPHNAIAAYNLAVSLDDRNELDDAIGMYRMALRLDPRYPEAHFNLGRLYERVGRPAEALRHMSRYRTLAAGDG